MKATRIAAILVTLAATAGSAFAQEFVAPDDGFVSTRTRAEVIAEVVAAREAGTLQVSEYDYPSYGRSAEVSHKTRAEVAAELEESRRYANINDLYTGG